MQHPRRLLDETHFVLPDDLIVLLDETLLKPSVNRRNVKTNRVLPDRTVDLRRPPQII